MACFQVVEIGAQMGFSNVEIEGDSLIVIRNLKENGGERLVIGVYIYNIRASCVSF